ATRNGGLNSRSSAVCRRSAVCGAGRSTLTWSGPAAPHASTNRSTDWLLTGSLLRGASVGSASAPPAPRLPRVGGGDAVAGEGVQVGREEPRWVEAPRGQVAGPLLAGPRVGRPPRRPLSKRGRAPGRFVVKPGQPLTLPLRLVGAEEQQPRRRVA